ncbi:MAG: hypothetical protein IJM17_03320, partial [Firmicutes bacterium]|nr:hypothetical protein [Bacillota bacterium]
MSEQKLVIIDGNSLVNRAFYAIQRPMITSDGFYTNGIYGFLSMLFKIRKDYEPTHMLVAFDRKAPTFRHLEFPDYKAGRKRMPEELAMEMPVLKELLSVMGIKTYELDGFEADDIMGTAVEMAESEGMPALVITGDKDALQLAGSGCTVIINRKGVSDFIAYDEDVMMEEYGFSQGSFIDFKALYGDPSDNIPGVAGVGKVSAQKLIQQFGSIENLYENIDEVAGKSLKEKLENGRLDAFLSKRLATIIRNVPVEFSLSDCEIAPADRDRLIELYSRLEFKTYLAKLMKEGTAAQAGAGSSEAPEEAAVSASDSEVDTSEPVATEAKVISCSAEAAEVLKRAFSSDELTVDLVSDLSHVKKPSLECLELLWDGGCAAVCPADGELTGLVKEALKGSKSRLTGFNLGRLYYVLMANGIDVKGLSTAFDCALAQYVLHPGTKAPELKALIFELFHEDLGGEEASGSQVSMFDADAKTA